MEKKLGQNLVTRQKENPESVEKMDSGFLTSLSANFIVVTAHRADHSLKFENEIDNFSAKAVIDFIPTRYRQLLLKQF